METVLITGANGFVGRALSTKLISHGRDVCGTLLVHESRNSLISGVEPVVIDPVGPFTNWDHAFIGVDTIVHLAARVHIMHESSADPLSDFRLINTMGTERLAHEAAAAGVNRFVFMSTIGVNGDNSGESVFYEGDKPHPHNEYSISKWEAERCLFEISKTTGMEVVIIRPPLVYGSNAPGNFGALVRLVHKGIPLPLGAIHNKRSMVGLDNLVDFIITCIDHPAAANQTFLVADGEDLSTTELLRRVGQAMGKPARLIPVPMSVLKFGARLLGKQAMAQRLCGNLQVDISKARKVLGWSPPVSVDEGLRRAVSLNADSER